jgi:hypothetical protein
LDAYDHLLHNIDGGLVLRKKKFDDPVLDQDNMVFDFVYSKDEHSKRLKKELDLSHLQPEQSASLTALIKKYWCVFNERGTFVPVQHYQCIIDSGSAAPIAVKQIPTDNGKSRSWNRVLPPSRRWDRFAKSLMVNGSSSPPCPQAPSGTHQRHQGLRLALL